MKQKRVWRVKLSDLRDITNFNMKVLLDNMPEGIITEEQKNIMIKDAKRWRADYLIYAIEFDGIHYFHYGIWKDLRPRFSGLPFLKFFDKEGNLQVAHYSLSIHLPLGNNITGLLSTGQY